MCLRIHLEDNRLPSHIRCGTCDLRRGGAARPTPRSPEIDEKRNRGALDDLIEKVRIDRKRLSQRRQRHLALSASPRVGKVFSGDTVLAAAVHAGSNDWHD